MGDAIASLMRDAGMGFSDKRYYFNASKRAGIENIMRDRMRSRMRIMPLAFSARRRE